MRKKKNLQLTNNQINDLIVCVSNAVNNDIGYGNATKKERGLLKANRHRLLDKLKILSLNDG